MLITIQNEHISLTVDTRGAQMMSIRSASGCEYLWQGDPQYWKDRAPTLFPFIGRLTEGSCRVNGKRYLMGIHGFAAASEFTCTEQSGDKLVLTLFSNAETRAQYPFDFSFCVTYALQGSTVAVTYSVRNESCETMPFGIGGHPGFRVPLAEGEVFEDYCLEFSSECQPDRVGFTQQVYLSGVDMPYSLEKARRLPLRHSLFDEDAIIPKNMAREVTLRSQRSGKGVTVSYPGMPYVGFWHWPKTDAPYVCIEPWSSLPARQDVVEELTCKSDLVQLPAGKTYENTWTITVF